VNLAAGSASRAQGLLKFPDLSGVPRTSASAKLELFTTVTTTGTVNAYRMIQPWDETATWDTFGPNGIANDGVVAERIPAFSISNPRLSDLAIADVTSDVQYWLNGGVNEGWVFMTDSTDAWDFSSAQSNLQPPRLAIRTSPVAPTRAPVSPTSYPVAAPTGVYEAELKTATDAEIRSNRPNDNLGNAPAITVDLSDGGVTQGLLKFDLTGILGATKATLELFTTSPTSGTISAYRMLQSWKEDSTWNTFGFNGVQNNGVQAALEPSFTFSQPRGGELLKLDVSEDVQFWTNGGVNEGWVFISDSNDGWDFMSAQSEAFVPTLKLRSDYPLPTMAPTKAPGAQSDLQLRTATDTEIRYDSPSTGIGYQSTITVDQSDGGSETQGLLKFDLRSVAATATGATLSLLTISPTSGTITAYRMIQSWNQQSTWNSFGPNGVVPDDIHAASKASFQIVAPQSGTVLKIDVSADVHLWQAEGGYNQGWVFISDSTDGWDFTSAQSEVYPPTLTLHYGSGRRKSSTDDSGGSALTVILVILALLGAGAVGFGAYMYIVKRRSNMRRFLTSYEM
ncbi:MAG: DNRLRE domain-containing protein, partial [Bacteroidota bacterium]